ncbi:MAG: ATP-dependent zinc protease [Burkholderiales bacterium]|nr:ATP-dependent zinc protease [Burkholderiales bacterium]
MNLFFKNKFFLCTFFLLAMGINAPAEALDGPSAALEQIDTHKKVISPEEYFWIEGQARFSARIDSGAKSTSIHAIDIEVEDAAESMMDNVGKQVSFTIMNEEGDTWSLSRRISSVTQVRNSQGVEYRYNVPLRLGWNNINKTVDVNLRDRSKMTYKLLIGRDWMNREVVIDLEQ